MDHLRAGGRHRRPAPELPAFCRTRRAAATPVMVSACSLRALRNLLLVVLALQLSTLLLLLAGPVPAPLAAAAGGFTPEPFVSRHGAPVPSLSQP